MVERSKTLSDCDYDCHSCTSNHNPLLRGLDLASREALDLERTKIKYHKGEFVFKQGAFPSGLFCLSKGQVMISRTDDYGNSIITNLHKEVTFLGIADYVSELPYQSTALCLSDCEICMIKEDRIKKFLIENGTFARRVMRTIARDYHQANSRMLAVTKKHMSARIADALLELYEVFGVNKMGDLDVYLKRDELAVLSNMSMANVIRQLSSFQKSGLISISGKKIEITDMERLRRESDVV